jgi:hypothetical protein
MLKIFSYKPLTLLLIEEDGKVKTQRKIKEKETSKRA